MQATLGCMGGVDPSGEIAGVIQGDDAPSDEGKQCCKEAMHNYEKQHGQRRASGGNVVCCFGKIVACSWAEVGPGIPNQKALKIMQKCVLKHEEKHFEDVGECNHCMGEPFLMPFADGSPKNQTFQEMKAHRLEAECLFQAILDGECGDDRECLKAVLKRQELLLKRANLFESEHEALTRPF